jgi:hypothetical protein
MSLFTSLLHLVGGCSHKHTYRERRPLHRTMVLHLVCEDCGYAVPAVQRSAKEHRQVVKAGALPPAKIVRETSSVVAMNRRAAS